MTNALDYLNWRGDLSFEDSPFNEVDFFLCGQLSTPDYSGIVGEDGPGISITEVADKYFETHTEDVGNLGVLQSVYVLPELRMLPGTARFRDLKLSHAVNRVVESNTEQFAAVTIEIPGNGICVSIRGTDDTIIGWKEDFNLATKDHVPAQEDAVKYLIEAAKRHRFKKIRVCGHSKGGNLAIFAAANAPKWVQRRIERVCSFDGPGFREAFFGNKGYLYLNGKVSTVLSQNAIVGKLLNPAGEQIIVKSSKNGPMAHDGFSWEVIGDHFVKCPDFSESSKAFDDAMTETLDSMDDEEKQEFVDELFDTLLSTGATTITELKEISLPGVLSMAKSFHGDKKVHRFVLSVTEQLIKPTKE